MITEEYCDFETSKLLKEKGFDVECDYLYANGEILRAQGFKCNWNKGESIFTDYKNECSAPTLQMAMKWLRDVHNLHIEARITNHSMSSLIEVVKYYWVVFNTTNAKWVNESSVYTLYFDKYEDACASAIKNCLENLI